MSAKTKCGYAAIVFCRLSLLIIILEISFSTGANEAPAVDIVFSEVARATYSSKTEYNYRHLDNGDIGRVNFTGNGVLLDSGHFITVAHVVSGYDVMGEIFHFRPFTRIRSSTRIQNRMADTREKLIEEKIDNYADIAVFRVPETSIDDYQFISIELAEDLVKYVGKEVHLVKPSKGLINGFYTNRGTILSVRGDDSMYDLDIEELDCFFMAHFDSPLVLGDSGSAVIARSNEHPQRFILVGLVSASGNGRSAIVKSGCFMKYIKS